MVAEPVRWPRLAWWQKFYATPDGCWLWIGSKTWGGYGKTHAAGENVVHRSMYRLLVGPIPPGLQLDHLCRVKDCANPAHLEPVTAEENIHRQSEAKRALRR